MVIKQKKISCIIPAYNEGKRIGQVLRAVHRHPYVQEVIVINDGSKDNIKEVVKSFKGVKLLTNKVNQGKCKAMLRGMKAAKHDYYFFLDADLVNLQPHHITRLIEPILKEEAEVAISLRKNAPWIYKKIGLDFISGERVFHKGLLKEYEQLATLPGFGLEVYINEHIIKNKHRISVVLWEEVESPYPNRKYGWMKGSLRFLGMIRQIEKVIGIRGAARQIVHMHRLKNG